MAEYLARDLSDDESVTFASAGTGTRPGAEPSTGTRTAMAEVGISLDGHESRSVWQVGDQADVFYVLSSEHRQALVDRWPERAGEIHMLRPDGGSVDDPYGMELDDYRRSRAEIEAAVRARNEMGW